MKVQLLLYSQHQPKQIVSSTFGDVSGNLTEQRFLPVWEIRKSDILQRSRSIISESDACNVFRNRAGVYSMHE